MIADMVNTNKEIVKQTLHDELNMTKVCAEIVPKILTREQKDNRMNIYSEIMERLTGQPGLLTRIIACDETWILQYDPKTKRQLMHRKISGSPRQNKSTNEQVEIQGNADRFLRYQWCYHD